MQATTEEGQVIRTCVDCERWSEDEELIGNYDGTGQVRYFLCRDCYREDEREAKE